MSIAHLAGLAAQSGGVLFVMPLMLLVTLTISIERTWYLGRMLTGCRELIARLAPLPRLDRAMLAQEIARQRSAPVERLLAAAVDAPAASDRTVLDQRFEEAIMLEVPAIDRSLWVLDTTVTLAPLLGLLGTIIGMFNAFQILGQPGSAPTEITGGVAEALIATASGLFIAIIGLTFFNGLQDRVRLQIHELETLKVILLNRLTVDGGEKPVAARLVGIGKD
ncbi:MAG: MotA/TolQ/ExbB proton channel family protein [Xanthobacteraceae bacterium]|nr:MotA/TolQ/ExbB proton channel family protein [Xanthobacteraceae bacterium]